jgi:predicted nucleic acid-binding protein
MRTFFDSGVLVYLFDADAPGKQERIRKLLREEAAEGRVVLSTQVLQEFFVAVTRKMAVPLSAETAERALSDLARLPVIPLDSDMVRGAAARSRSESIPFWTALAVEAALAAGAVRLFTEDLRGGTTIDGLTVVNPFTLG